MWLIKLSTIIPATVINVAVGINGKFTNNVPKTVGNIKLSAQVTTPLNIASIGPPFSSPSITCWIITAPVKHLADFSAISVAIFAVFVSSIHSLAILCYARRQGIL